MTAFNDEQIITFIPENAKGLQWNTKTKIGEFPYLRKGPACSERQSKLGLKPSAHTALLQVPTSQIQVQSPPRAYGRSSPSKMTTLLDIG